MSATPAERLNARLLQDRAHGRDAVRALQRRAARDPYLHATADSPLLGRPLFLTRAERQGLERGLSALVELLLDLPDRLFAGDISRMCAMGGLSAAQRAAVEATWRDREVVLSRADVLRAAGGFKVIEVNVHSSLGGIDSGPWHHAFLRTEAYREFLTSERLTYVDPMDGVAQALRTAAERAGRGPRPTVAIVDWPSSFPVYAERLERVARLLEAHGFRAFACHAGELALRDGRLTYHGREIDVLYRIFLLGDVPESPELLAPILDAYEQGELVLAMGFAAELCGNKSALAMLSEGAEREEFSSAERELVRRLLPWTRLLLDPPDGLLDHALRHQDSLVLKPADGHGGHGVMLGCDADRTTWREAVERALGEFWVLQERVDPIPELIPTLADGELALAPFQVNWGVFVMDGRYGGTMIRAIPATRSGLIGTSHAAAIGGCFCPP